MVDLGRPYSATMPGTVKPRLAGFMMSMTSATTSTSIRPQWASVSGASSGGVTAMSWAAPSIARLGSRP